MIKKLRNYNKQILAGVSALLLVVFLAPSAVQQCTRLNARPSTVWATTTDGGKLTLGDKEHLRAQLAVLEVLRDPLTDRLGLQKSPEHWWLLVKEARDAGLVGGTADGRQQLEGIAQNMRMDPNELLARLAGMSHQPTNVVLDTLAELRGVYRLADLVAGAGMRTSDNRTRLGARELLTDVAADVVPIDAANCGDAVPVPPPTPDQLAATFEKGKTHLPGSGPGGIGYKFPDRVKLEWIFIPGADLGRSMGTDPALGPVELRKEYLRNPAAYGATAQEIAAANPAASYDAHKDAVRDAVLRRLVKERAERISTFARDWSRAGVKDLPSQSGIVTLPPEWKTSMPPMATLAGEIASRFSMPAPRVDTTGEGWVTVAEAGANPFLSKATTSEFGQPVGLAALLKALHEFDPHTRIPVQAMLLGPVLSTATDDLVLWRVSAAEPSREPAALDEVREAVLRDTLAQMRYDELVKQAPAILARANADGLASVARQYGAIVETAPSVHLADRGVLRQIGARFPGSLPKAGSDIDAIRAVVQKAVSLPANTPISTIPDAERTLATPVPAKLALLIVRITGVKPLTLEDYTELTASGAVRGALSQDEPRVDVLQLFSLASLEKRQGYVRKNPEGPDRVAPSDAPAF